MFMTGFLSIDKLSNQVYSHGNQIITKLLGPTRKNVVDRDSLTNLISLVDSSDLHAG